MKIVNMKETAKNDLNAPIFTGPGVTRQVLAPESDEFDVDLVNFPEGVRNKFHTHDSDQVLIVISGKGIVASEEQEREVIVGDVIYIPAGEKHRHGAGSDSEFSHIYIKKVGSKTDILGD